MVAIQKVEYDSHGQIAAPRKELMNIRRELNGKFSSDSNHWHRHTIAAETTKSFEKSLAELKAKLSETNAEVIRIDRSGPTVVDIFYLIENKDHTANILRAVANGNCPRELSLNELNPTC